MTARKFTEDDAYKWLEMYNDGMTHEEIALEIGASQGTVGYHLRKLPEYKPRSTFAKMPAVPKHGLANQGTRGSEAVHPYVGAAQRSGHRRRRRF
jgi:DNA-binding transcriptional ArsR family regulator